MMFPLFVSPVILTKSYSLHMKINVPGRGINTLYPFVTSLVNTEHLFNNVDEP